MLVAGTPGQALRCCDGACSELAWKCLCRLTHCFVRSEPPGPRQAELTAPCSHLLLLHAATCHHVITISPEAPSAVCPH